MEPLVDVAAFGRYLQRTVDPDAALAALVAASGAVREHCGWSISAETATFVVDGSGTTLINLPTMHLTAVHEVRVLGRAIEPGPLHGWPGTTQYAWSQRGQLMRAAGWPGLPRAVEVDVDHGYAETPSTVAMVVCSLAEAFMPNVARELASKTVGAVTHTYRDMSSAMNVVQTFQLAGYTL